MIKAVKLLLLLAAGLLVSLWIVLGPVQAQPELTVEELEAAYARRLLTQPSSKSIVLFDNTVTHTKGPVEGPAIEFKIDQKHFRQWGHSFCAGVYALLQGADLILSDHAGPVECTLWTGHGLKRNDFIEVEEGERLYIFWKHRLFIYPTVFVGHKTVLPVAGDGGVPMVLETLSERPRLFRLYNLLSDAEIQTFVDKAEVSPMKRSTGGLQGKDTKAGHQIQSRTSENTWDLDSPLATKLKTRSSNMLRIPRYDPEMMDGFQIVKYGPAQGYAQHQDWFALNSGRGWNWDPSKGGVNRFATLFLYLSNCSLGGETVFPNAGDMPTDAAQGTDEDVAAITKDLLKPNSWEDRMVKTCRTKHRVLPEEGHTILFYHQLPEGHMDSNALHGACPVLQGEKLGANLWIWNDKRWTVGAKPSEPKLKRMLAPKGTEGQEGKEGSTPKFDGTASFHNEHPEEIDLFWVSSDESEKFLQRIQPGVQYAENTMLGHQFVAKDKHGKVINRHIITADQDRYICGREDL